MLPKVWSSLLTVNIAAFVTFVSTSLTILKKKVKHKNVYAFIFVRRTNRTEITYFFSPSYNKNDSNVGGAFILKPRTILCFLQSLLRFWVLTSTTIRFDENKARTSRRLSVVYIDKYRFVAYQKYIITSLNTPCDTLWNLLKTISKKGRKYRCML